MAGEYKRFAATIFAVAAALILLAGGAATAGASNFKNHFAYFAVVASILVGVNALRLNSCVDCDVRRLGEIGVQGGWLLTSFSLVYITLAPAKIYSLSTASLVVTEILGLILLVMGAYLLLKTKKETGVALSI